MKSDSSTAARQPKVADLEVAVGVQEQVGRLQVAVQHVRAVHVLQAPQQLVQEVLYTKSNQGRQEDTMDSSPALYFRPRSSWYRKYCVYRTSRAGTETLVLQPCTELHCTQEGALVVHQLRYH